MSPPADGLTGVAPLAEVAGALLEALPVGVAAFDAAQRAIVVNASYCASLGMAPGSYPPGTRLAEMLRSAAYRGALGPGDPERQLAEALAEDRTRAQRLRRRRFAGRVFDVRNTPLPSGGHLACKIDMTAVIGERDRAQAITRTVASAIATLRTGLAVFAPDGGSGRLVLANPRLAELIGGSLDRLVPGETFAALVASLTELDEYTGPEGVAVLARQRALDRAVFSFQRHARGTGEVVDIVSAPLPDGGFAITATDVTALVRAEDDSRRRARTLEDILDAIPQGVIVYGPDLRASMVNRSYALVIGEAEPILAVGEHLDDVLDRRIAAGEFDAVEIARILRERETRSHAAPVTRRRQRGNGRWLEISVAPMPDGGHVRVVSDITALMAAKAELSRRAADLDSMLANIRHGITLYGADARLIAFNQAAVEILNQPVESVRIGMSLAEIVHGMRDRGEYGSGPEAARFAEEVIAHDPRTPRMHRRRTKAGRVVEMRSQPTPEGGFVYTSTDITDAVAAEAELRRAKDAAEAASLAKSRFLATMSHELRTPLHSVIGFADALLSEPAPPDPAHVSEYASAIQQSGRQLLALINSILDVSRLESEGIDLADDPIEMPDLIRSCLRAAAPDAAAAQLMLAADVRAAFAVRADHRRLAQAIDNLVSNAVKFSRPGGTVTVGLALDAARCVRITVTDAGIGIAPDDLARVFEPFTQIDAGLARRFPGAGLGLYVARALVEAHGGALSLNSRLGEGTCATVTLPCHRVIWPGERPSPKEPIP